MHTFISFVVEIISAAVVVGPGVLVAQNGQNKHFTFLGTSFQADMG